MLKIIVGLGNPDPEYTGTRHNTGRSVVQFIQKKIEATDWVLNKKIKSLEASAKIANSKIKLVLPETFMNNSGKAVKSLVANVKSAKNLVVIYDDIDLPFGIIKMSFNRGAGGHKGLESICRAIKTEAFIRLRVGICPVSPLGKNKKPEGEENFIKYILGKYGKREEETLKKIMKASLNAITLLCENGYERAMNEVNSKK